MGILALALVLPLALMCSDSFSQEDKGKADKIDQIIKILEEMRRDAKAMGKDVGNLKERMNRLEQEVEKLKKQPGVVPAVGGKEAAPKPMRPPQVREFSSFVVFGGKGRVDESIDDLLVAQGKEQGPGPAPAPAKKEAVVEVKNNWSNEVTVILNDKKYKVAGKDSKTVQVEPGDFTYQIEGVTDKIKRTVKAGEKFSIIVRSTEPAPKEKEKEDTPAPPAPSDKDTGTLSLVNKLSRSTTVVVNKKQYVVQAGQTVKIEVPAGKVRSYILGTTEVITTDCVPGGNYIINIQADTRYQQPRYYYPAPGPTYFPPPPVVYGGYGGCGWR
jgi:hypothetical protein